jgi:tetratricopeptide (TPR) repeat protein
VSGFRTQALAIFATALAVRLLHLWQMRETLFFSVLMGDARGYDTWARQIAGGDWMGHEVFYQAPFYPYFLGLIYLVFGRDLLAVRIIQAVLGAVSSVLLGYAASRFISRTAGLVAGLMLALYPPAIFFDALIQKSVLDVLFVCLVLAIIGKIVSESAPHASWWMVLGLAVGGLSLTRENALVFAAVILAWAWVESRRVASRTLRPVVLCLAGLFVVLLPVAIRNSVVGDGFYLTTSQFGSNFYIGNNPQADGSYMALRSGRGSPEFERIDATQLAEQARGQSLTPAEVSRYWAERALDYIATQPGDWLRLLARKSWLVWSGTEMIDTESLESHAEYSLPLGLLGGVWHFGTLLPIAVPGLVILWRERRRLWPVYAMFASYAVSVILFFVVARYRYPLVPFVMLFASAGIVRLPSLLRESGPRRLLITAAAAILVAVAANWPLYTADARRAITENNLGAALQEEGRPGDAVERYKRALALDATYTPALNNLGTALRATGRVDEAVAVYGQALSHQPDSASVHYNLGNALAAKGDRIGAIAAYRRAIAVNPRYADAYNNLGQVLAAEGRMDEAIHAFRQALAIDDRAAIVHGNLGNALASRGAMRDAIAHLQRASALAPDNAAARYDLGSLLLETGAFPAAASELREAIRLRPDYAEAHNNLGIALASQGQLREAMTHWREAIRLKPDLVDARRNLERVQR